MTNSINNNPKIDFLQTQAKEYEKVFLGKMLNIAFENVKFDPFTEKESEFKSLLVDEYAKYLAPYIGIDKHITNRLLQIQEVEKNT